MFIFIALALISIFSIPPTFLEKGVLVTSIKTNSSIFEQGLRENSIITEINSQKINSLEDYSIAMASFSESLAGDEVAKLTIVTKDSEIIGLFSKEIIKDINVQNIPKTRITTGLDLQGGVRALVTTESHQLTDDELSDLILVTQERLNVYGLSDVTIKPQTDLSGNKFMIVEIAGSSPEDLENLIASQGKFEAKIGEEIVFVGGEEDITHVSRTASEGASVYDCQQYSADSWTCYFRFPISLSPDAAKNYAEVTKNISINISNPDYLSQTIDFYIDDELVDSLLIDKDLQGSSAPEHSIQGSGSGTSQQEALEKAKSDMNRLQTILKTGSLPFKLKIEKVDKISANLGQNFLKTILLAGLLAGTGVFVIIFIRYRKIKISLLMLFTMLSEILIVLGIATIIGWNIDLAGIAGIIATIGTGVDDQIVIVDESQRKKESSLKQRIKSALFIIFTAYATTMVSLFPLLKAGAGLLAGFAVTTLIGISAGVFITRPAFADMIKQIGED